MKCIDAEKLKQPDKKEVLLVPVEVIPEQMSIEQFLDAWRKEEPAVLKIIETKCGKVILDPEEQPEADLEKLVNEEFASHSRTTEYGLEATYNRAELYQLIKRMALVFNARKEESL